MKFAKIKNSRNNLDLKRNLKFNRPDMLDNFFRLLIFCFVIFFLNSPDRRGFPRFRWPQSWASGPRDCRACCGTGALRRRFRYSLRPRKLTNEERRQSVSSNKSRPASLLLSMYFRQGLFYVSENSVHKPISDTWVFLASIAKLLGIIELRLIKSVR